VIIEISWDVLVATLQAQENSNSLPPNKLRKTASGGFASGELAQIGVRSPYAE